MISAQDEDRMEERLAASVAGYERLLLATRELRDTLSCRGTSDLNRLNGRIERLTEEIDLAGAGLGDLLIDGHGRLQRHPLVLRILDLLNELREDTSECLSRLEAARSAIRDEIARSRQSRSALGGYRSGPSNRGRNLSAAF